MSHAVYDTTRYHLVWAPKYRKWILDGEVRETAKELFKEILAARDCEVIEMEIAGDHVHIFASIPPRYSVGEMVRVVKSGKCEGNFQKASKGKEGTVGRRILGRRIFCQDGRGQSNQ